MEIIRIFAISTFTQVEFLRVDHCFQARKQWFFLMAKKINGIYFVLRSIFRNLGRNCRISLYKGDAED